MFGNRRRKGSTSSFNSVTTNTSSSAALAASQAYLNNSHSTPSLAAAAAGAALRSRPTTPISVANVQTKRTQRRDSISSVTSGTSAFARPSSSLHRSGSSGSMTERTFRSPSPSGRRAPVPAAVDAPPVPAVPKNLGRMRAASVEAPPVRVTSPTPRANGRGSSMGPAGVSTFASRNNAQRTSTLTSVSEMGSLKRSDSAGSVNFSYPTGNRAMSPYGGRGLTSPTPSSISQRAMSPTPKQQLIYDPNTRTMRPASEVYAPSRVSSPPPQEKLIYDANTRSFRPEAEVLFLQQELHEASQRTVASKHRTQSTAGTHLAQGSIPNNRPKYIDQETAKATPPRVLSPPPSMRNNAVLPSRIIEEPESPSPVSQKKTKKRASVNDSSVSDVDVDSDGSERTSFNTRAGAMLVKRPSTIRERDEEEDSVINTTRQATLRRLESSEEVPTNRTMSPSPRASTSRPMQPISPAVPTFKKTLRANSQPPVQSTTPAPKGPRVASVSPSRKARFSLTPTTNNSLTVRHDPPARSISPRKSALKHTNSPRGTSPAVTPASHYATPNETPDVPHATNNTVDPTPSRKKSVRVSFDEDAPIVLGNAAETDIPNSPMVASPQHKKWFNVGRKKKESFNQDDEDERMTPRAALPSFASIRDRQTSNSVQQEERPLRTPTVANTNALVAATAASASAVAHVPNAPLFTAVNAEKPPGSLGSSMDHGAGAVFAQDANNKIAAIESTTRETLRSEANTNGDNSAASSVYEDHQTDSNQLNKIDTINHDSAHDHAESYRALTTSESNTTSANLAQSTLGLLAGLGLSPPRQSEQAVSSASNVPDFSLTEPTPILESKEFGMSPDATSGHQAKVTDTLTYDEAIGGYVHVPKSVQEESGSEEESYVNAHEDLSAEQGNGFMSLNAIAASPVKPSFVNSETGADSPTSRDVKERVYKQAMTRQPSEPDMDAGWAKAQQYWSGLSQDRKRELELQALTDMDKSGHQQDNEDSDTDFFTTPPKVAPYTKTTVNVQPPVILPPSPTRSNFVPIESPRPSVTEAVSDERTYQVKPGQKAASVYGDSPVPKMRSSMRSGSVGAYDTKSSLRDGSTERKGMRMSMRDQPIEMKKSARIAPLPLETAQEKHDREVQNHVRNLSAASAATAITTKRASTPSIVPTLQRKGSNDSDSSFKRRRSGGNGFKKGSMRNPSVTRDDNDEERPSSSRFSVRTLSPSGSILRRPFGATNREIAAANGVSEPVVPAMPMSLKDRVNTSDLRTTTLRPLKMNDRTSSTDRALNASLIGRKSTGKTSRFADDSDDETPRPKGMSAFRSRFNDSSDEDDGPIATYGKPNRMTTMRAQASHSQAASRPSTHSRQASNVSTMSTISSTNGNTSAVGKVHGRQSSDNAETIGKLDRSGSGRDTIGQLPSTLRRAESPTPKGNKRRGSIISVFRRKRPDDEHRVTKSKAESPARRDTQLERTPAELAVVRRTDSSMSNRPKLQKRNTASRGGSDYGSYMGNGTAALTNGNTGVNSKEILAMGTDWPLAEGHKIGPLTGEDGRPYTADDAGVINSRPTGAVRRYTNDSLKAKKQKKKKFGMLRRAFGLDL